MADHQSSSGSSFNSGFVFLNEWMASAFLIPHSISSSRFFSKSKPIHSPASFIFFFFHFTTEAHYLNSKSHNPFCSSIFKRCHSLRHLFQIQARLITSNLFRIPFLSSQLLQHFLRLGHSHYALTVFYRIPFPDTLCVNLAIKAHSTILDPPTPNNALSFYFDMLCDGFKPNSFTFPPLICSCTKFDCIGSGGICHAQSIKNGVDSVLPVRNCLIHMYGCFGLVHFAYQLFDDLVVKDLVSWNSIIHGHANSGDLISAHKMFDLMPRRNVVSCNVIIGGYLKGGNPGCGLKVFREMMLQGLRGSETTVVLVLTACARSARSKEGRSVHAMLVKLFDKPSLILNTALIDMYSKCRMVDFARVVFDRMVYRNLVSWNAMVLGHCIYGEADDGLNLFRHMVSGIGFEAAHSNLTEVTKKFSERDGVHPDEITLIGVLCGCARAGLVTQGRHYFSQMVNMYNIKPNFAHYWCMANLLARVGLHEEAEGALRSMPEITEDLSVQSLTWAGLLATCRFQGDVTLGERVGSYFIEQDPQNSSCYAFLLNVYSAAQRWEDVVRIKAMMKEKGVQQVPGLGLVDLKRVVHDFKGGHIISFAIEELIGTSDGTIK